METEGHHVRYATQVCRYFTQKGLSVHLITSPLLGNPQEAELRGVSPLLKISEIEAFSFSKQLPGTLRKWLRALRGLHTALRLQRPGEVLHILSFEHVEIPMGMLLLRRAAQGPVIATLFSVHYLLLSKAGLSLLRRSVYWTKEQMLCLLIKARRLSALLVHTQQAKEILDAGIGNCEASRVHLIPDVVPDNQDFSVQEARTRLGIRSDLPMLLFPGQMRPEKGWDVLLAALKKVRHHCQTWIVGEIKDPSIRESDFETARTQLPQGQELHWRFGFVPDDDFLAYFHACDAVVLPYKAGFLNTSGMVQTAALTAKPLVTSNEGVRGEIVTKHRLGLLYDNDDPELLAARLNELFSNYATYAQQAKENAPHYVALNSIAKLGEQLSALYGLKD